MRATWLERQVLEESGVWGLLVARGSIFEMDADEDGGGGGARGDRVRSGRE